MRDESKTSIMYLTTHFRYEFNSDSVYFTSL